MENIKDRRLRLWKARQTAEGHDVSGVKTLEEAEHFFDKREQPAQSDEIATPVCGLARNDELNEGADHNDSENPEAPDVPDEAPEIPDEEETTDEQCTDDPVDEPV